MAVTKLANLINPEVMADMISAKIANAIVVTPFARLTTLCPVSPVALSPSPVTTTSAMPWMLQKVLRSKLLC